MENQEEGMRTEETTGGRDGRSEGGRGVAEKLLAEAGLIERVSDESDWALNEHSCQRSTA